MSTTWQTARVFISSTFRDMHAERDHLVKTVFPALREQLAKYRVHLVDIDLRWGVTQEQSDNDLALDLCLEQIEDCRPFFIGLLGERYGYVPKRFNQEALSRYGWVQHYTDKSITELEILHGVLRQPRMHDHAFFFFRDPAFKHDVPPPKRAEVEAEDAESAQNLERLKQDIRAARLPVPPVENYPCHYRGLRINRRLAAAALDETARRTLEQLAPGGIVGPAEYARLSGRLLEVVNKEGVVYLAGLEAFGQRVHDQLWQAIQAELKLPEKPPAEAAAATDPLAEEADYHERFMESRLRVYVGRESIQQQLLAYANSDDTKPLLVTGPSGTGKSAVLARFVQSLQSESTIPHSALRIPHFVGASPNSTSLRQMLRRFCLTLRNKFGYTDQRTREGQQPETIPAEVLEETNKLVSTFQDFLKRVPADVRVVIVIDALNQLDETDNAQALHWLPWQLPPNVKMVLSCIEEEREEVRGKGRAAEAEEINREDGKSGSSAEPSRPRAFPVQSNSARQPSVLSAFQHRPHIRLQVEPLTDAERLEIVRAVPSLSAKTLDDAQIALLLENPATRNPLFLLVALEELRGFGSFERLNDRIRAFPREGDTLSAIFQQVIERLEEEFDPTLVRRLLSLLACARIGLSEQELQELLSGQPSTSAIPHSALRTPQSPLQDSNTPPLHHSTSDFFPVLRQLRPYLQYRGTLVDFYHRNLFKAVRERYLGNADTPVCDAPAPSAFQSFHYELANYFRSKSDPTSDKQWKGESPRPFLEVVFHLAGARLDDELCGTLCDLRFVEARCPLGQVFELQGDYRLALKTLPEAQPELVEERRRQERAALWTADIIEYSRRCNAGQTPPLLENIPSVEPWSDGRIEEECRRIIEHPSRLDRLREFAGFVESECYSLIGFGKRPGFVAQHAFNHSPGGSVHDAAARTIGQAREPLLLRQWPPSARHNPKPALRRTLEGHGVSVESVSVTADGRRAVSGSWDKTLRVWDLESGACLRALEGHSSDVKCVSVTADGRRAVSGSRDKTLRVWDLESGACLRILKGHSSAVSSLGVTADGRRAVSGSWDKTLRVWDLESGQCLRTLEGHSASVWSVSVTADGRRAVSGNSASRPGDRRVVSGSDDGALRVWDLESGQCLRTLEGHGVSVESVSVTPDGRRAVSGAGKILRVWDLESGACLRSLEGHSSDVKCVSVTPDGRCAVSGSWDKTLRVWDLESGACLRTVEGYCVSVESVSVTADGRRAVSCGNWEDKTLRVWDLEGGVCLPNLEGHSAVVWSVGVTPDGRRAVSGSMDKTLRIWDLEKMACPRTLKGLCDRVSSLSVTPDGRRAVSGSWDSTLRVWDLESGACLCTLKGLCDRVSSVSVTPDGRRAVSGSWDKTLQVWDLESGACLRTLKGHSGRVSSVSVTPDGQRAVSGSRDKTLRVWDLESGACLRSLEGHSSDVKCVSVTPDGRCAVSGSWDKTLRVWDLESGACLRTLEGHSDSVSSVNVMADGRRAVSANDDKTLRVWDLENGACLAIVVGNAQWYAVAYSVALNRLVAGTSTGEVAFFDLANFD